jgi:ATP-binding cassette subfamily B protein
MGKVMFIKRMFPYFKRYKNILFIDLLCAGLTTAAEMILPILLRHLTNIAQNDLASLSMELVLRISFIFIGVKIIELVASYYMASIGHMMGAKIENDMRSDLYNHLQTLSDSFYNETKIGSLMSRITNDLSDLTEFCHHGPEEYFIGGIKIVFSFIILSRINLKMTLIIYLFIPIMIMFASKYNKKMKEAQKKQRVSFGDLNSSIQDSLLGIRVVKSFANEDIESEKFDNENLKLLSVKSSFYKALAGFTVVTKLFDGIMYLLLIVLGGYFMINGELRAGDMIAYVMYITSLLATVRRIVEFTEQFQKGITAVERFSEIMAVEPEITDSENAVDLKDVEGKIEFKDVSFKYEKDSSYILKDFNLKIEPGENIAIVGPSGAGKTTVCNLIPRFYDVNEGQVLVDGHDVRDLKVKSLRENIGVMQQDVYLFSGSVMENIRYGRPGADDADVIRAAELAGAMEFIEKLPGGFDTYVGERGLKLSGGQKQRISIARVFLKNPRILILDEATSALDNKSEEVVQESLEKLAKGRTTISIAHRLTTVQNADEIIVMNQREIVERGNHEELMAKKGYYYQLYTKGGLLNLK